MTLTPSELDRFETEGYLFFPGRFTPDEAAVLHRAADEVYAMQRDEVWRESNGAPRTAFAAHLYNEAFRRLGAHPRLVEPQFRDELPREGDHPPLPDRLIAAGCLPRRHAPARVAKADLPVLKNQPRRRVADLEFGQAKIVRDPLLIPCPLVGRIRCRG